MALRIILLALTPFMSLIPTQGESKEIDEPPTFYPKQHVEEEVELVYGLVYNPKDFEDVVGEEEIEETQQVTYTSFYDSNLGWRGYKAYNFNTNQYGMTIDHEGYVVVATATNECLRSNDSGCARYTSVPSGFNVWSYGDTFKMYIEKFDTTFNAKVYDSCGACFWDEEYQRVDIHTKGTSLGKIRGEIIIP